MEHEATKKCTYCSEIILKSASKCRFCGEWLNRGDSKSGESSAKLLSFSFVIWAISIAYFLSYLSLNPDGTTTQTPWSVTLLVDIFLGVTSFLVHGVLILRSLLNRKKRKTGLFFGILTSLCFVGFVVGLVSLSNLSQKRIAPTTPPDTRTTSICSVGKEYCIVNSENKGCLSQEDCKKLSATTNAVKTNTGYSQATTKPNMPVHCSIPQECGGGTTPLTQSECENATCCQINGKMTFTKDKNSCDNATVRCGIAPNCGGGIKEMTKRECDRTVCCEIGGTWTLRDRDTCNQEQDSESYSKWNSFCSDLWKSDYKGYNECMSKYSK